MISQRHLDGIEARGLSIELATSMGIFSGRRSPVGCAEPDPDGHVLCFPYFEKGERLNVKMRWYEDGSRQFQQEPGKPKTFWNADVILDPESLNELDAGNDELLITEGEFDALAAIQCGHTRSMSVPNGATLPARDKATGQLIEVPNDTKDLDPENDRTFSYITRHMDRLQRVKSFLIATDADEVGQRLAKELVRRIGPARCKWVRYPDDLIVPDKKTGEIRACKDLNEVLQYLGEDKVRDCLENAKPFPIKGLFSFSDYPDMGEPITYPTRLSPELDDIFRLYPGAFMVATGIPNMGKSEIIKQIAVNMGLNYGWHTVMFVGEEPVKPYLHNSLRTKFLRKERRLWTPEDESRANAFVEGHFQIIGNDPRFDEDEIDIDFILDKAATSVFRYGTKMLVIDPWNELEHKRDQHWSMTEYVGDAIRKLKRFGRSYDVCVVIVAHPKKLDAGRVPGLYDISDSAHWANKPDLALIVHGEDPYDTAREIIIPKVRFRAAGRKGSVPMQFDRDLEMYIPVSDFDRANDNGRDQAA